MSFTNEPAPLLSALLGDSEISKQFSEREDIETMIGIEGALAVSLARAGVIPQASAQAILNALGNFEPDLDKLEEAVARDGVAVPELVRQLRIQVGETHAAHVHLGATSQDIIDTSLILRLRQCLIIYRKRLKVVLAALDGLDQSQGTNTMVGRTRMQAALPISVGNRLATWRAPLAMALDRLAELEPRLLVLQFGGAVGILNGFRDKSGDTAKGREVAAFLAKDLKLQLPERPWHTDRSALAEFAGWLSLVTGALGKIGQDIALMAQNEISEIGLSATGGSSTMPHKQNPVKAEALVTLARFNATQVSAMHHSLVHEQERSGSAWTLEWMVLPQMCVACGAAMRNAGELLNAVEWIGGKS
jgi:3-carboxy-cis,cis-muconate cycloisomerase